MNSVACMHGAHTHTLWRTPANWLTQIVSYVHRVRVTWWLLCSLFSCCCFFFSVSICVVSVFFSSLLSLISIEYVYHLFIYTRTQTCKIQFVSCDFLFIFVFFYSSCSFVATHCNQFMVLTNQSQKNITFLLCDFFMSVCMWYTTRISTNYIWNYFLFWSSLHNSCSHKIN